jgi:ubiquinone biosynthesis protein
MNPPLLKIFFRPVIKSAAYLALVGRNRDHSRPEQGRFTRADVGEILERVWHGYDRLAPSIPREPNLGTRMNMLLACITLSCFQVMLSDGVEREYAIELIGDMAWKVYEKWGYLPIFIARLSTRDPRKRIGMSVKMFLRFPFASPGYIFERVPSNDGISLDMLRCPIAEYFRARDGTDLCIGTWCNLDFPLAELWGGWLERTETLAAGRARCDFRFKAVTQG